jgi:hypothetical protein
VAKERIVELSGGLGKAIEEKVWETVKKLRERDISKLLV